MNRFLFWRLPAPVLVVCLSLGWVLTPDAFGQDQAERLGTALSQRYESIEGMRLRFVQTATSAFMDEEERYSGMLTFTDTAYHIVTSNQTIVTDGTTTWVHNRGEGQVIINDFVEDESDFSLTQFLRSFSDEYDASYQGTDRLSGVAHERLRLLPRADFASFRQVDLWIRSSDGLVTRLIAVDLNDVRMVFELSDIEVNPNVSGDFFEFSIPDGAEIVDLREEG
ncbi:MAG: outer membrane lipoprotein carrier protein LolA [Bacteroidota bacterium]|nr:outer membrane lipoprotein carrier protein LolA [Bacteroidota bacterium]